MTMKICPKCGGIAEYDSYHHAYICTRSNCDYWKPILQKELAPVRHGKWICRGKWYKFVCSECLYKSERMTNYCPNCGAKMDGRWGEYKYP